MHGVEPLPAALRQDADEIDHGLGVPQGRRHRGRIAQIGLHRMDLSDPAERLEVAARMLGYLSDWIGWQPVRPLQPERPDVVPETTLPGPAVAEVPEPSQLALFGVGLAMLCIATRRRKLRA